MDTSHKMENPHEEQQSALIARIIANVTKLNHSVKRLNTRLEGINKDNSDIELISNMWSAYSDSVKIHLESSKPNPERQPIIETNY